MLCLAGTSSFKARELMSSFFLFVLEFNENFSHLLKYHFQLEYFNEREKHNRSLLTGFHRCKLIQHFLGTDEFLK